MKYPYICYLCWVKSPADDKIYQTFQKCIDKNAWESASLYSIALLLLLSVSMLI